ncbi:hypothetical protein O9929_08255 [Vibrio lentus]|nr:hypothetical protein [Vibrio lentus]
MALAIQFALGAFGLYIPWGRDLTCRLRCSKRIDYGKDVLVSFVFPVNFFS